MCGEREDSKIWWMRVRSKATGKKERGIEGGQRQRQGRGKGRQSRVQSSQGGEIKAETQRILQNDRVKKEDGRMKA